MSRLSELSVGEVGDILRNHAKWSWWGEEENPLFLDELGRVEVISADTGGEGASDLELVWRITSLEDGSTRLFIKTGYWVSHDGAYWDGDFRETSQKQKVVTYYE
jgi:hypothetical protein